MPIVKYIDIYIYLCYHVSQTLQIKYMKKIVYSFPFLLNLLYMAIITFVSVAQIKKSTKSKNVPTVVRIEIPKESLKKIPGDNKIYLFHQRVPDADMKNLEMPGDIGKYGGDDICGKIVRVLRYQNITFAVERRYDNLPKNILLAMMMEESTGIDMFGNANEDGGIGLIHMQPELACDFGLHTFNDCCKMRCTKDQKALEKIIEENNHNRKRVVKYDDRLNPVLNIDAAARMLSYYMELPVLGDLTPMESAIKRYAWKWNYKKYLKHISINMAYLSDPKVHFEVDSCFNSMNKKLTINGKSANFKMYIKLSQAQAVNYGLYGYNELPLLKIKNADDGAFYKKHVIPAKKKIKKIDCNC